MNNPLTVGTRMRTDCDLDTHDSRRILPQVYQKY